MFLYHYSKEIRQTLLSKSASGVMKPIEIKLARLEARRKPYDALPYCDHISFFFEPIPASLLPKLFGKDHPVWVSGNKLYEHIVDVDDLPQVIPYHVVESKKKTALYDQFVIDNHWEEDDPDLLHQWQILEDQKTREWGEKGNRRSELIKQISAHQGTIADNFREAVTRDDFEWNRNKYAANVPHLMLYPPQGAVKVFKVKAVTLGVDTRRDVISTAALR